MSRVILFNKPFGVLSQFTPADGHASLADFIPLRDVYPAGRLDADSEGLVVLTDDGTLQALISEPRHKLEKAYWVQVEGEPPPEALRRLAAGLPLGDFVTAPCKVRLIDEPEGLWPRVPPVRYRASIPTRWIEVRLREGKNRQVRRMTAHVGHPALRLIRHAVGDWSVRDVPPGTWIEAPIPPALVERLRARRMRPARDKAMAGGKEFPARRGSTTR